MLIWQTHLTEDPELRARPARRSGDFRIVAAWRAACALLVALGVILR